MQSIVRGVSIHVRENELQYFVYYYNEKPVKVSKEEYKLAVAHLKMWEARTKKL
ncbi:hypothetical protein [Bacillus taeanensis]|uniref:hypothetical protein n=1 Tax=Bacillus taeanensis TaxID=273032 RepID=UPI0015F0E724|nr:hypothetical protein [Bacillus taeanensis]